MISPADKTEIIAQLHGRCKVCFIPLQKVINLAPYLDPIYNMII